MPLLKAGARYIERNGESTRKSVESKLDVDLTVAVYRLGLSLKSKGFREEQEWRLTQMSFSEDTHKAVKFRDTRLGPAPYVEVPMPRNQLKWLGLGPRVDRVAERSLRLMLKHYGCDAQIYWSEVSYR